MREPSLDHDLVYLREEMRSYVNTVTLEIVIYCYTVKLETPLSR